jgi:precorrin-2 C20-methyltransferase / precorrin-3B C17-methyltransferase
VLLEVRAPETVVVVGRDVGGPEEEVVVTTLGALDPETVDMRCLVVVGSSQTRASVTGAVYTPRTYPDPAANR